MKDTVDVLLEGQREKGCSDGFCEPIALLISGFSVAKRNLVISIDGLTLPSEIHFTVAIDTSTPSAVDRAIGQAQDNAQHARGFVGLGTGNEAQTILAPNPLASLLSKIATFNDFVTAIAEVRRYFKPFCICVKYVGVALQIHPYGVMAWKILSLLGTVSVPCATSGVALNV
jgi:hypothetical protein